MWKALFEKKLATPADFADVWYGVSGAAALKDQAAVPFVAPILKNQRMLDNNQRSLICSVYSFADATTWATFQADLQPWTALSAKAQAVLADPTMCAPPRVRPEGIVPDGSAPLARPRLLKPM
jgi:hypothetical protein